MVELNLDNLRVNLQKALETDSQSYVDLLAQYWGVSVDVSHEPQIPSDGFMDVKTMIAGRQALDRRFALVEDFKYVNVYSRLVANVIYLFCDHRGTYPNGDKMDAPLCTRFTVENGKIEKVVLNVAQKKPEPT